MDLKAICFLGAFWSGSAFAGDSTALLIDDDAYLHPQVLVEVEPGRKLNLYCTGTGSPTVVFDAGLTDPMNVWGFVHPAISKKTRACSYDRGGIGFSDEPRRASTSANIMDDLHKLLAAAHIDPPYVLVGHSAAGLNMKLYAYTYPKDIAGMVLVDPSHEDQRDEFRKLDPRKLGAEDWDTQVVNPGLDLRRDCIKAAGAGLVPGTDEYKKCGFPQYPQLSKPVQAATVRMQMTASFQKVQLSEEENVFRASANEVRAARRSLGKLPLIVLTADHPAPPTKPLSAADLSLREARYALWAKLGQETAKMSSRGINRIVQGAGHVIQLEKPEAVIDAIEDVLGMTREKKPGTDHGFTR
ncbi:MAG: alpha/beta hydrolase [Gammaproteobacteria bacterium]|nr:alpha/beta hydrolase [Gammaproteobacteria bacterium]